MNGKRKGWFKKKGADTVDLLTGLISCWELDETSGTNVVDANSLHDGTNNNVTVNQTGILNKAYLFNSTADNVTVPDSNDFSMTNGSSDLPFSLSCWVNLNTLASSSYILAKYNPNPEWLIQYSSTNKLLLQLLDGSNYLAITIDFSANGGLVNTWFHMVATYDGSETIGGLNIYLNGSTYTKTELSLGTYTGMTNNSAPVYMGTYNTTTSAYLHGLLDQTAVWKNRELTQTEVTELYNDGNGLAYTEWVSGVQTLVPGATVNLDAGNPSSYPGSGTTWFDLSGNGYNATLVNGVGYDSGNSGVLTFDGINDYVALALSSNVSVNETSTWTTEVWFKYTKVLATFDHIYTQKNNSVSTPRPFVVSLVPAGFFATYGTLTFGSYNDFVRMKITPTISKDGWYQLVITFDGVDKKQISSFKCYLNGVSQTISGAGVFAIATNVSTLASESGTTGYLEGSIPIWNYWRNKEFNQTEVTQNFDFYKSRFGL